MKSESSTPNERFLSRWSRLKREQAAAPALTPSPPGTSPAPATTAATGSPVAAGATSTTGAQEVPVLPPVESLTFDSDFAPFFQPKVPQALRNAAVKKLFADPHFNIMDGLDTYIDDYTKADPLPEGWLEKMNHARDILDHPSNRKAAEEAAAAANAEGAESSEVQQACRPGDSRDPVDDLPPPYEHVDPDLLGPGVRRDDSLPTTTASPQPVAGPPASDTKQA